MEVLAEVLRWLLSRLSWLARVLTYFIEVVVSFWGSVYRS